jgi:hypothetical protein
VRNALLTASFYGVRGAVPQSTDDTAALTSRANAALQGLQQRQSTAAQTTLPPPDPATAVDALLGVVATVLGKAAIVLPHVTPAAHADLQSAFGQSAAMQAVDPQALVRWLLQLSHIRPGVQRLDMAMTTTTLLGAPQAPPLTLGQLPLVAADRWLGLPIVPGAPPTSGRVAIAALAVGDPATQTPLAGLLLDEWLDRIPATTTTAGLSFHYDEPTARPPQALLLAVCPDARAVWDLGLVQTILEETLALAKIRAVDLDSIQQVGQILPGLYVPFNLQAATVGTQFLISGEALGSILSGSN